MYCTKCNRFTDSGTCPECGGETIEEAPHVVYWCGSCNISLIHIPGDRKIECPICGHEAKYLCADMRPVFPEERLLFEVMTGKPLAYIHESVWASGSKYYVNGKATNITVAEFLSSNPIEVRSQIDEYAKGNSYDAFDRYIDVFVEANRAHLDAIVREACSFVVDASKDYPEENLVVSFSGGKDSTVTHARRPYSYGASALRYP